MDNYGFFYNRVYVFIFFYVVYICFRILTILVHKFLIGKVRCEYLIKTIACES